MTRTWTSSGPAALALAELVGDSVAMKRVREEIVRCASCEEPVLIVAPRGPGKGVVARCVHRAGSRRLAPFVTVDCPSVPATLFESLVFGHEAAAFTGATDAAAGHLEQAERGTVFLDEIGEVPLELQPKLLRLVEDRRYRRLGAKRESVVHARFVAATNRPLQSMAASGAFRADLFDRLDVHRIHVPTLAERREDVPLLASHFAAHLKRGKRFTPAALDRLMDHPWAGNVRQLQSMVVRICASFDGDPIPVAFVDGIVRPMSCPPHRHLHRRRKLGMGVDT